MRMHMVGGVSLRLEGGVIIDCLWTVGKRRRFGLVDRIKAVDAEVECN